MRVISPPGVPAPSSYTRWNKQNDKVFIDVRTEEHKMKKSTVLDRLKSLEYTDPITNYQLPTPLSKRHHRSKKEKS